MISSQGRNTVSKKVLDWYYHKNYNFPWRNIRDPYSIWLSEVMLQQTRVSTVLPYYKRWLSALPDIMSVSKTDIDIILKLWEGLGYYSRARNFHKACQIIMRKYDGNIPEIPFEFLKLPGVGPYISSAVMSIAFNLPLPAIDGNAVRVISRLYSINLAYPKSKKQIFSFLSQLINHNNPGDFSQAVMDLGREICTASNPSCHICPIYNYCNAYVSNSVNKYPIRLKKKIKPHFNVAVGVIWWGNKILVSKRRESGLLAGLWEFPGGKIKTGETSKDCVFRKVREELGVLVKPVSFIKQVKHSYTHLSISIDAYHCHFMEGSPRAIGCAEWRWILPENIDALVFPASCHRLFESIKKRGGV